MIRRVQKIGLRWLRQPSVRVAMLFAVTGAGYAGGNLLLARALTRHDYGLTALWLTLFYIGGALAPWGADGVVNRRRIAVDRHFLRRTILTSAFTGVLVMGVGAEFYPFEPSHLALLSFGIVAAGATTVAAAQFQARQRFIGAMAIWQGSNVVLLAVALLALLLPVTTAFLPLALFTAGAALIAGWGWLRLPTLAGADDGRDEPYVWSEAMSYYFGASATAFLPQIERLVIPGVLSLEDLAMFGVLAALVLSPFRMLESGVGYTLLPRMSGARGRPERRHLLRAELRIQAMAVGVAWLVIWYAAPWLTEVLLGDKYTLEAPLLVAGLVAGSGKVFGAVSRGLISALGSPKELAVYGAMSWVALLAAGTGAWLGARWGVPGVIYGTLLGLSSRWLVALALSARHLVGTDPAEIPNASTKPAASPGSEKPVVCRKS